jgi:hypothetical protein
LKAEVAKAVCVLGKMRTTLLNLKKENKRCENDIDPIIREVERELGIKNEGVEIASNVPEDTGVM